MPIYVDQMFNETTARTTLTEMLFGTGTTAGQYSPLFQGSLAKVSIFVDPQAASSLCESGHIILTQTNLWRPNAIIFPFNGWGLQTVAGHGSDGTTHVTEYVVDLAVETDKPITGELIEFDSPVTPRIRVVGTFTN